LRQGGNSALRWLDQPTDEELAAGAAAPPCAIHLPSWTDSEWCKQLVGEQLVTVRTRRGFARLEGQKLRERNEALDCRVYARAAAWIAGADRTSGEGWAELERRVNDHQKATTEASSRPRARRRRVGRVGGARWTYG
jgi:phage terminase large subunit GpA-like protein